MNGFIACRSDEILPEFHVYGDDQYPAHGSVIWAVEDGVKRKAAVYDDEKRRFMIYDENQNK
ncbi:hypothetical protein BWD09_12795 [Neisseria dentiae]|uniref:Uncharacterized protein n=1 Tax=Neisseria dentiae TaxID=194197 RepID=A0A1X3D1Z7_9NEIS|nr:hypothetical protein [Neisseria dentiae]OSI13724.1 hypothetical protein BWD09_12795 [Neisseria dentiae]QMT44917.1 hypothetical protein H3L92_10935 [Neisseria dentiae]